MGKRICTQLMNVWFYPFMLIVAFNAYAFDMKGALMLHMVGMTIVAALGEYSKHLDRCRIELLTRIGLKLCGKIDELEKGAE